MRDEASSPYTHTYTQKRNAAAMDPRSVPYNSEGAVERSNDRSRPLEGASDMSSNAPEGRPARKQAPTPPWLRRPYQYAPPPNAPAPSLGGSMRFTNASASWGLNGAFSGAWGSARPAPTPSAAPGPNAWMQAHHPHDRRMGDDDGESSDSSYPERTVLPVNRTAASTLLPGLPSPETEAYPLSESDILLRTKSNSKDRTHPAAAPSQPRARATSWGSEALDLPPIRMSVPQRASVDYSPFADRPFPPAKRACVQLPSFPDFIQGSSRLFFSESATRTERQDTSSPPPSPSPSVVSFSTTALSGGQTDTEPTEEEDVPMVEQKQVAAPRQSYSRPAWSVGMRELPPARPSPPIDEADFLPRHQLIAANLYTDVPKAAATARNSQGRKGNVLEDANGKPSRRARTRANELQAPPPKKYRFVASHLSGDVNAAVEAPEVVERGRPPAAQSGSKRKHASSPSLPPSSSSDMPASSVSPPPISAMADSSPETPLSMLPKAPPSTPAEPPKRRGRPPRPAYDIESVAPIDPDSPEGKGQFPVYRYVGEQRATRCQFYGCKSLLTGKKAQATTHLKEHFHKAGGRMLLCPWDVVNEAGDRKPCGKKFKDSANMGRHVATKHLQTEKYECGRCFRPFARRDAALRHMKTMCSPEKEQRRAGRRIIEYEPEDEDNDGDNSGSSRDE
ncbi:hypothetical protein C8Q77DRAFT_1072306 [Trametes polyzona]|nr:hypothetical protein C8Q77DRAFT_1072306 [Trametes polyzona]